MVVRDWSRQQFGGDDIVDEIRKALSTGVAAQITAGGAVTAGNNNPGETTALRLENLDNTMTSVLATAEHLKIFRWLHKEPSKQPFYQWNRRESYGSTRGFFGFQEGSAPNGGKGQWSRNGAYVKFLGTKGGVTHPAVLTNILGGMSVTRLPKISLAVPWTSCSASKEPSCMVTRISMMLRVLMRTTTES